MKSLHNLLFLSALLSVFLFFQTSCQSTLAPELVPLNTELSGEWEVLSFQLNGVEQIGHAMNDFTMEFAPEAASSGNSKWAWSNLNGEETTEDNFYTLSADGGTILLSGEEYSLDMDADNFELSCDQSSGACVIVARHL